MNKYSTARVIAEHKGAYTVKNTNREYLAKITGKQIFEAGKREDYPAVGDWVSINKIDNDRAIIQNILPRHTILAKKYSDKTDKQIIATNIDVAFIVESLDRDYNLNRFERYIILTNQGGIKPIIILNKTDAISKDELANKIQEIKKRFHNIDIIATSSISSQGTNELMRYLEKDKTYCLLGSSGVGKSTLINKLVGNDTIKIGKVSETTGRGKHTTTAREMYFLKNGAAIIDNPGTREVGIADANIDKNGLYNDIGSFSQNCRYSNCTHTHEPGCAVLQAIKNNEVDDDKYQNYLKLKKENEFYKMSDYQKRRKDRKFGQFLKNAKKDMRKK